MQNNYAGPLHGDKDKDDDNTASSSGGGKISWCKQACCKAGRHLQHLHVLHVHGNHASMNHMSTYWWHTLQAEVELLRFELHQSTERANKLGELLKRYLDNSKLPASPCTP